MALMPTYVVILSALVTVSARYYIPWDNRVYCGRQFDDYVTQTVTASPLVIRPALLVLYEPHCYSGIAKERQDSGHFPKEQYLVIAKHDYETYPENIWYHIDERDDLKTRYNPVDCPEYLYFEKGTTLDKPERYNKRSGDLVRDWIWDKYKTEITFKNSRSSDVAVEFKGNGPRISAFTVQAGHIFVFKAYISYCMIVSDVKNRSFLYGMLLEETTAGKHIEVTDSMAMNVAIDVWYQEIQLRMDDDAEKYRLWRFNVACIYLLDFKQPVMLRKFTKIGYMKSRMPDKLFKALTDFYKMNEHRREAEEQLTDPHINELEVKCGFVKFDNDIKNFVSEIMLPEMEEWSNTSLILSSLYGVREYYTGNILRNHVDRVDTHVISVILQIAKELGGQPDWELEIIDFNGNRKNITLDPGDMLFYESATLIHGRPFPFQGKVFANAFLHFRPRTGWTWEMSSDRQRYINGHFSEMVDEFPSQITSNRKNLAVMKDEL